MPDNEPDDVLYVPASLWETDRLTELGSVQMGNGWKWPAAEIGPAQRSSESGMLLTCHPSIDGKTVGGGAGCETGPFFDVRRQQAGRVITRPQ